MYQESHLKVILFFCLERKHVDKLEEVVETKKNDNNKADHTKTIVFGMVENKLVWSKKPFISFIDLKDFDEINDEETKTWT